MLGHLEVQILLAVVLDWIFGDPRWLPHPVKGIGWLALTLEKLFRKCFSPLFAGIVTVITVIGITLGVTYAVVEGARQVLPWLANVACVIIMYLTFAARDLELHAKRVFQALEQGNIKKARSRAALMVGRDTENLDESQVVRATVESVAENTVDGVIAPIIFAFLAGPLGAMAYKAVSTLDSTFGYKNQRYLQFGWAAARLDDLVNWLPARLTAPLMAIGAGLAGMRAKGALRIFIRDHPNHPSPNSGWPEAAMAGALGVRLGGMSYYQNRPSCKPGIGDAILPLNRAMILQANRLTKVTTLLLLLMLLGSRWLLS